MLLQTLLMPWANRELFQIAEDGCFKAVAGVPPDYQ